MKKRTGGRPTTERERAWEESPQKAELDAKVDATIARGLSRITATLVREADVERVARAETPEWPVDAAQIRIAELAIAPATLPNMRALRAVLDYAQNPPPQGSSDGSISTEGYAALRRLQQAGDEMAIALGLAHRAVARDLGLLERGIKARGE